MIPLFSGIISLFDVMVGQTAMETSTNIFLKSEISVGAFAGVGIAWKRFGIFARRNSYQFCERFHKMSIIIKSAFKTDIGDGHPFLQEGAGMLDPAGNDVVPWRGPGKVLKQVTEAGTAQIQVISDVLDGQRIGQILINILDGILDCLRGDICQTHRLCDRSLVGQQQDQA